MLDTNRSMNTEKSVCYGARICWSDSDLGDDCDWLNNGDGVIWMILWLVTRLIVSR